MVASGVGFALVEIASLTLTQRLAAGDVLGRVYGVEETLYVAATALGGLLGALLVRRWGHAGRSCSRASRCRRSPSCCGAG